MNNSVETNNDIPQAEQAHAPARKLDFRHGLALFGAVAITVAIFVFHDQLGILKSVSYLAAFLTMLIGNATIILPVPGLLVVYLLGGKLNPLLLGLSAGPGAALGELTGYMAGYGGSTLIHNVRLYQRIDGWMRRYGLIVISVLAAVPNPVFDMAGIVAGSMKLKWWQFLLAALLGKTIQAILISYAGHFSIGWVRGLLD